MINPMIKNRPIAERFDHLLKILSSPGFLKREGLGNEVPFFICPYDPTEMIDMDNMADKLSKQLKNKGIKALIIDLYSISIELLKRRGLLDKIIEEEQNLDKDELKELLQGTLDVERHLVPYIKEQMDKADFQVMMIIGVGQVFPYIRSHNVLNNLQKVAKDQPTLMFFPGEYTHSLEEGASLDLFGLLQDDKYYRAFNIYNCEV